MEEIKVVLTKKAVHKTNVEYENADPGSPVYHFWIRKTHTGPNPPERITLVIKPHETLIQRMTGG